MGIRWQGECSDGADRKQEPREFREKGRIVSLYSAGRQRPRKLGFVGNGEANGKPCPITFFRLYLHAAFAQVGHYEIGNGKA